jgi:pyrroline-5-carboxylate reductase
MQHPECAASLAAKYEIKVTTDNRAAVADSDIVLLCVKPQVLGDVVQGIAGVVRKTQLIISIAASVPTSYIETRLPEGIPVIRAMPNTPSMVGAGMTAFCCGVAVKHADLEVAQKLFGTVGEVVRVDEKHMDAVTGLSASGPA